MLLMVGGAAILERWFDVYVELRKRDGVGNVTNVISVGK